LAPGGRPDRSARRAAVAPPGALRARQRLPQFRLCGLR